MFFKTVDSAQRADAGAQLQRVIAFRDSLIVSKMVLFKEFGSADDWEKMLRGYLLEHIFSVAKLPNSAPEGPSEPTGSASPIPTDANAVAPAAGGQIAELAKFLGPAFYTGRLGGIAKELGDANEVAFWAVRALLLSAALVAESGTSGTTLPTHELNTLYLHRDRLRATEDELYVLLKTILVEEFDTKPGWYWFRDDTPVSVTQYLAVMAFFEHDTQIRAKAFETMRRTQTPIFFKGAELREIPSDLRDVVWAYLVDAATQEDVQMLRESASNTWLDGRIEWLQAWAVAGRDLNVFLSRMPDPQLIPEPMKQSILAEIPQLGDPSLHTLSSIPTPELREAALTELRKRGTANEGDHTPDRTGQGMTLASMRSGPETVDKDRQDYERLSREDNDSLRKSLIWADVDGPIRYRLLLERGEIPRETARKDLSEGFQRIRNESDQRLDGRENAATFRERLEKLQPFIKGLFTTAALEALAADPAVEDVALARQFLNDFNTRLAALRIVVSKGSPIDVKGLIEIARSSYGEQRQLALTGVKRLAADRLETAGILMASEARELRRAAVPLIQDLPDESALPFLESLLVDADESVRLLAVGLLRLRCGRERLIELLRRYTDRSTYFYNVVVWLDRVIYAPAPMSGYYATELDLKLKALEG